MTREPDTEIRPRFGRFFIALVLFEVMFIGGIVFFAQRITGSVASAVITCAAIVMIVVIASAAFRMLWNPLMAPFPPQEVPRTATQKSFQSFSYGFVNMGGSINAATDDTYLHMEPILIWRALGARSASIPFTAMKPAERGRGVLINGRTMMGPKWCFERAGRDPSETRT